MDSLNDRFGRACLEQALQSKSMIGFGAVLVRSSAMLTTARNCRSTAAERRLLTYVNYAIHAEKACFVDALRLYLVRADAYTLHDPGQHPAFGRLGAA